MYKKTVIFILILHFYFCVHVFAQDNHFVSTYNADTSSFGNTPLTILYNISVNSGKSSPGIEESYNGGNKTIFINGNNARIRLVSLMRIQSIFFFPENKEGNVVSIVKESGKQKKQSSLTKEDWLIYNQKYDGITCTFIEDSIEIMNYNCKKAIIRLQDGKEISAYYTGLLKAIPSFIEPSFKCIPGLVLQYSYATSNGSITYTAEKISEAVPDPALFRIPAK